MLFHAWIVMGCVPACLLGIVAAHLLIDRVRGLTYSSFSYTNIKAMAPSTTTNGSISFTLTNTGKVTAAEVAQLYLSYPESAGEPPNVLRGFSKVSLGAGESKTVVLPLTARSVSIWDVVTHDWALVTGLFTARVGASSRDLRLTAPVAVSA